MKYMQNVENYYQIWKHVHILQFFLVTKQAEFLKTIYSVSITGGGENKKEI